MYIQIKSDGREGEYAGACGIGGDMHWNALCWE